MNIFSWPIVVEICSFGPKCLAPNKKKKNLKKKLWETSHYFDVMSFVSFLWYVQSKWWGVPLVSKIIWRPFATLFLQLGLFCWGNFDIKFWDYLCRTHKCFKCGLNPLLQTRNSSHTCNVCAWWWLAGCQLWVLFVQILTENVRQRLAKCLSLLTLWVCLDVSWTKGF